MTAVVFELFPVYIVLKLQGKYFYTITLKLCLHVRVSVSVSVSVKIFGSPVIDLGCTRVHVSVSVSVSVFFVSVKVNGSM